MKNTEETLDTMIEKLLTRRGERRKKHIVEIKSEFDAVHLENQRLKTKVNTLMALLEQEREVVRMQRDTIKHIMADKKVIEKELLQLKKP